MKSGIENKLSRTQIHRRSFLKGAVAAASAFSTFSILTGNSEGKDKKADPKPDKVAANEKVNLACCGIGAQGGTDIEALYKTGHCNIVALCDTDMEGPQTKEILKKFPDVPRFQDFRKMLDKMGKEIDAVTAGVPDFSHFPITMLAMSMGKHVYSEKPMARTFQEVELMMAAEKKYKVCGQMGNQGHSGANYFQFKAWTEAGIIKNVTKITAFMNSARRWHGKTAESMLKDGDKPMPSTLDWDTWLGTAEFHKYNANYVGGQWRCWYDFGLGALGDWGAHILDTAHQFLNLGLPTEISAVKLDGHSDQIFPQASTLLFKFPERDKMPPVEITWYDGTKNLPPLPEGFGKSKLADDIPAPSSGKLEPTGKAPAPGKVIYGEGLTFKGGSHSSTLEIIPKEKAKEMEGKLPKVPASTSDHYKNFLLACKGQEKCRSSFDVAGPLSQVLALGVLAQRLNTTLVFDREKKQITNNKAANDLLAVPPRKGWEQYYKM